MPNEEKPTLVDVTAAPAPPPPTPTPNAAPDGGLTAWLQVVGSFFLFMNGWGIVNTFGAYQAFYEGALLSHRSSSDISWIGTFQAFLLIILGTVAGPVFDLGYMRALVYAGTFFIVFGMMMTSICSQYWSLFLAQGACVGLGAGCIFLPSVSVVATYFSSKRAVALGISAVGSSMGGVIYPIVFRQLQPKIGFGWTMRVTAFIILATQAIAIALLRARLAPPGKARRIFDAAVWRSPQFDMLSCALFFTFLGLYTPFFYIVVYASRRIGTDVDFAFYSLTIMNAASALGRVVTGLLADRYGALNMLLLMTAVVAVLAYAWIAVSSLAGLVVFCILYGFFSGSLVSLPPTVVATLTPDMREIGTWMGMVCISMSLGALVGAPVAGTLISVADDSFLHGQVFGASILLAAVASLAVLRMLPSIRTRGWKV